MEYHLKYCPTIPKSVGGMLEDLDLLSTVLMAEEMGYADAGLADKEWAFI